MAIGMNARPLCAVNIQFFFCQHIIKVLQAVQVLNLPEVDHGLIAAAIQYHVAIHAAQGVGLTLDQEFHFTKLIEKALGQNEFIGKGNGCDLHLRRLYFDDLAVAVPDINVELIFFLSIYGNYGHYFILCEEQVANS